MIARRAMDGLDDDEEGETLSSMEALKLGEENYEVAPRNSVELYIGFEPPPWLFSVDAHQDRFIEGNLEICFGDGSTQIIALNATAVYPQLLASPLSIDFGKVNGRVTQSIALSHARYHPMLRWTVTHVPTEVVEKDPRGPDVSSTATNTVPQISASQPTKLITPDSYDLPEVFEFSKVSGVLPGPSSGSSPSSSGDNVIHISFKPDHIVTYDSKFRLATECGNHFMIHLRGIGASGS